MKKATCPYCGLTDEIKLNTRNAIASYLDVDVAYNELYATCKHCEKEIPVEGMDKVNIGIIHAEYAKGKHGNN